MPCISLYVFDYHRIKWKRKELLDLTLMTNYSQPAFMWIVTNSLSVFALIQYCPGWSIKCSKWEDFRTFYVAEDKFISTSKYQTNTRAPANLLPSLAGQRHSSILARLGIFTVCAFEAPASGGKKLALHAARPYQPKSSVASLRELSSSRRRNRRNFAPHRKTSDDSPGSRRGSSSATKA